MDFEISQEQRLLYDSVIEFARRELNGDEVPRDRAARFSRETWERCAAFGLLGLRVPPEYGGAGVDAMTTVLALEALGYGCRDNGLIFSLNAQTWACITPITRFGSADQKQRYLPRLANGSLIAAHAMSEPSSGSDAFSLATTARPDGDGYILNGSKTLVTNAPESDLFVVFATTDRDRPLGGICAFLLERDTPGLEVGRPLSKMGLRTSPMSELFLSDCRASPAQVLGRPDGGMAIFNHSMRWERSCILASVVGTMRWQLERCVAYARERRQFDKPIGSFQAVAHRIAEMRLRLETSRLLAYRTAWLLDRGESAALEAALTKLHLSECFLSSSLDAVQIHGGYGYMTEYELERDVRDAVGGRLYSGTSEMQRNVIAALLGIGGQ